MDFLKQLFTWWNGQTIGTRIFTARKGEKVGEDNEGNIYYQTKGGERRWVIYNGLSEASRVSADWHGWLHHTFDTPPTDEPLLVKPWEKPHQHNATGGAEAYHPTGSQYSNADRPHVSGDYEAWEPN